MSEIKTPFDKTAIEAAAARLRYLDLQNVTFGEIAEQVIRAAWRNLYFRGNVMVLDPAGKRKRDVDKNLHWPIEDDAALVRLPKP